MTATYFTFNGTALSTYGTVTLLNDYIDIPERRGEDVLVPFRHGRIFVQKYYESRKMTFGIIIQKATTALFEAGMKTLAAALSPNTQATLAMVREDGTTWQASASVNAPMQTQRESPTTARVIVEFTLPSAIWRLSTAIADNTTTIDASPKAMTVTNPGNIEERDATIILTGPLQNTVITNSTNGCVLTYTGTIASPRVVTISTNATGEYVATTDLGANVIGNITHSGASALMVFNQGANSLSITDGTHTTGTVKVTFSAPFI